MNSVKYLSYYLIFKDCLYGVDNPCHNSLFSRIWLEKIEENNIRANREASFTREWLEERKKMIHEFMRREPERITGENGAAKYFSQYLSQAGGINFEDGIDRSSPEFSDQDRIHLTRAYLDLKQSGNYALVVLYYPVSEHWEYIKEKIKKENFEIIADYNLDFSGNLTGFQNLIHDIYNDYSRREDSLIQRKIALLVKSRLIVKIVAVDENKFTHDFYARLEKLKLSLRDVLTYTNDKNAFLNIHAPGDRAEARHLKHVLVSVNNLWYIRNRLVNPKEEAFVEKLGGTARAMRACQEDVYDFAVIGTGAMEAAGLWECGDIDVVADHEAGGIEGAYVFKEQYNVFEGSGGKLSNQALIQDHNLYFYCYGMKFCRLEVVRERYLLASYAQESSKRKTACINSYYNFLDYIDDKEVLNREIRLEFQRRSGEARANKAFLLRGLNKVKRIAGKILKMGGEKKP